MKWTSEDLENRSHLVEIIKKLNSLGECPATSGNYSFRAETEETKIAITQSGIDKELITEQNFVLVDDKGELTAESRVPGKKASDETMLHVAVYTHTDARCVLHVHGLPTILFAELFPGEKFGVFSGMEMQKAFCGNKTHEKTLRVPIFENTQDIATLAKEVTPIFKMDDITPGFILRGHGLYTWGTSIKEAKRHYEAFQYLFNYYVSLNKRG